MEAEDGGIGEEKGYKGDERRANAAAVHTPMRPPSKSWQSDAKATDGVGDMERQRNDNSCNNAMAAVSDRARNEMTERCLSGVDATRTAVEEEGDEEAGGGEVSNVARGVLLLLLLLLSVRGKAAHRDVDGVESERSGTAEGVEKAIIMLGDVGDGCWGWGRRMELPGSMEKKWILE